MHLEKFIETPNVKNCFPTFQCTCRLNHGAFGVLLTGELDVLAY